MHSITESLVAEHSTSNSGILLKVSVSCPCWPKTSVMITVRLCSPGDRSEMRSWSNNSPVTMEQHNQSLVSHHCCYTVSSGLTDSICTPIQLNTVSRSSLHCAPLYPVAMYSVQLMLQFLRLKPVPRGIAI